MATAHTVPLNDGSETPDVAVQQPWPKALALSSMASGICARAEGFLGDAGFDKGPWLSVGFAGGIGLWFLLDNAWQWIAAMVALALIAIAAHAGWHDRDDRVRLRLALVAMSITIIAGMTVVLSRSELIGAEPIEYPRVLTFQAQILERDEQPARERVRLVLAMRDPETGTARKVRVNVPQASARAEFAEGAQIRLRARLMPPASPMLPGGYDFARTAWFSGLAATGSALGDIQLVEPVSAQAGSGFIAKLQRRLSAHVRGELSGSPGTIAAAFASGDRGSIAKADEEAMRDAGLTHLLSISGLHVSAVIGAAYLLAIRLLALWPWLVLRVRLPVVAAGIAALAGLSYTLLTGAEVPTVRSCIGAMLVLIALAIGREPLSLRMVAAAAAFVLLVWPESLVGPSFQMSFSAVLAIVALHNTAPVKQFLAPREERWLVRSGRRVVMLLITGLIIEIALMPIVLFHFHRAGLYGAFANVIAIPLVTFGSMPLIALALLLDLAGLGSPIWWLAGKSLDGLLAIAHLTAALPGAVKLAPQIGLGTVALFVIGGLWLALWRGRARLLGFIPAAIAALLTANNHAPDVLVSSDGRHVGIAGEGNRLLMLRDTRSDYARDNMSEMAGMEGNLIALAKWPGADCSRDFCVLTIRRAERNWTLLMARSGEQIEERSLAAACDRSDIVIADRYLPRSCQPGWLKADRRFLDQSGGLAIHLSNERIDRVSDWQGNHGWWRGGER